MSLKVKVEVAVGMDRREDLMITQDGEVERVEAVFWLRFLRARSWRKRWERLAGLIRFLIRSLKR